MARISQIDAAIQSLVNERNAIMTDAQARAKALDAAIQSLRAQQKPKAAKRPAKGPKPADAA
jgi:hypothetical protein